MTASGNEKLRELILYIARRSEGDESFGKTKLNKILFYADFIAYAQTGQSITGQQYRKLEHGPAPVEAPQAIDTLVDQADLAMARRNYHGFPQQRPLALREPKLDAFTAEEIAIVDAVIAEHWGRSARDVSDLSHEFIGWQVARPGEVIPYDTVFADDSEPIDADVQYAKDLITAGR
jgi:hypothetical protein